MKYKIMKNKDVGTVVLSDWYIKLARDVNNMAKFCNEVGMKVDYIYTDGLRNKGVNIEQCAKEERSGEQVLIKTSSISLFLKLFFKEHVEVIFLLEKSPKCEKLRMSDIQDKSSDEIWVEKKIEKVIEIWLDKSLVVYRFRIKGYKEKYLRLS